jgi:hypothetical protein
MSSRTAQQIATQGGPWAQLRTGTVVEASGGTAIVVVGATTFPASIIVPFGVTNPGAAVPAPGALVLVGRQDASWAVLGQILGASGNLIENGSFEGSPPGTAPAGWTLYNVTGTAAAVVVDDVSPVAGSQAVSIGTASASSTSFLYSNPIAVNAGNTVQISAFASGRYEDGDPQTADASLYALWFLNDTDLYPTTSSPDTLVATATDLPQAPPWTPLSGSVVAPVSGFFRAALFTSITTDQSVLWDFAVGRRLT